MPKIPHQPGQIPILAARVNDPDDYDPIRRALWDRSLADLAASGQPLPQIYPDSILLPCQSCKVTIAVGPFQQEAIQQLEREQAPAPMVVCLLCAGMMAVSLGLGDDDVDVHCLGNPWTPGQG